MTDADDANLEGGQVRISSGFESGDDLVFVNTERASRGTYNSGTGVLTLTGTARRRTTRRRCGRSSSRRRATTRRRRRPSSSRSTTATSTRTPPTKNHRRSRAVNDAPTLNTTAARAGLHRGRRAGGDRHRPDRDGSGLGEHRRAPRSRSPATTSRPTDDLGFNDTATASPARYNDATGTLTLTGTATVANYQAALRSVTLPEHQRQPVTATRTVSFQVTDAEGAASNVATRDITSRAINDAPLRDDVGRRDRYTEDDPATTIDGALTVTDADDTNLEGGQVRDLGELRGRRRPGLRQHRTASRGTYDAGTGVLTLTGTARGRLPDGAALDPVRAHAATTRRRQDGRVQGQRRRRRLERRRRRRSTSPASTTRRRSPRPAAALAYSEGDGAVAVDPSVTLDRPENNQISGATVARSRQLRPAPRTSSRSPTRRTSRGVYNDAHRHAHADRHRHRPRTTRRRCARSPTRTPATPRATRRRSRFQATRHRLPGRRATPRHARHHRSRRPTTRRSSRRPPAAPPTPRATRRRRSTAR